MTINRLCLGSVFLFLFLLGSQTANSQANCSGAQIFTAPACAGDMGTADGSALFRMVNEYRAANKLPALHSSRSLNMVANRRLLDLKQNLKVLTHSWSNCAYDLKDLKTWPCVNDAPRRLNSGYQGQGYETLFRTVSGSVP